MQFPRPAMFLPIVAAAAALSLSVLSEGSASAISPSATLTSRMQSAVPRLPISPPTRRATGKIQHVVIIMQENRSFDDLFQGYPGADTRSYGYNSSGQKVNLQPVPLEASYDIEHDLFSFAKAYDNGKLDGFDRESSGGTQYGYVPQTETQIYFNMAKQYVLGDRMFTSHIDDSFISHQYLIAAQANHTGYFPRSTWGCDGGPSDTIAILNNNRQLGSQIQTCWDITTLGDELDAANKTWHFYASSVNGDGGIWSSYQAIRHIRYGADWTKDVINPSSKILTDVPAGTLSDMTWVVPTCGTSDHAGCGSNQGPAWVASVVNAIGQSKFWNTTAIFVMWDEWGGWYDHVPPPYLDYDGLGFRVPLLIISPYAKQNYVSHVQFEHGSLLRFAEDQFGLPRMTAADTRANSPESDAFNFNQPPRPFTPFASPLNASYFIHAMPDLRKPDDE